VDVILKTLLASITSPYNLALAASIALMLTRVDGASRPVARLLLRLVVSLALTWALGTVSDLIFPNSITWTVLPAVAAALVFRDFAAPARLVRTSILMCSWIYSLSAAEVINQQFNGGIWVASLVSLAYMLVVWAILQLLERRGSLEGDDVSLTSVIPVIVVCASGLIARAILYLRSDFGMGVYSVSTLESVLSCVNGQVAELVVYYATLRLVRGFRERRRLQAERHLMEGRLTALDAYRESGQNLRVLRHEVKNQYAYIKMLLDQGDYERAKEFFGEMSMRANPTFLHVNSGNRLVDDIVNLELSRATAAGVDLDSRIAVPAELPYEEIDLASVLMNLLDNAIEACADVDPGQRSVRLSVVADGGTLMIVVNNPATRAPHKAATGGLRTTKRDAELHGYGTGIVRKIAEKYDGVADFSFDSGTFTAKVMLALSGE
jgi:signal transduction histidine kinase